MTNKATYIPKLILIAGPVVLLSLEGFFSWQLHTLSGQQEQIKQDYTDINNVTLGLMSVDNWKDKVAAIVSHQVKHFKLTPKQKRELQVEVEQVINALINKADSLVNKPQKSFGGKLKGSKNYLVSKGSDSTRIAAVEYGYTHPIAPNSTAAGGKKNRRVEVHFAE